MNSKKIGVSVSKGLISEIPFVGGVINELTSYYQGEILEKRIAKIENKLKLIPFEDYSGLSEDELILLKQYITFASVDSNEVLSNIAIEEMIIFLKSKRQNEKAIFLNILKQLNYNDVIFIEKLKKYIDQKNIERKKVIFWDDFYTFYTGDPTPTKVSEMMFSEFDDPDGFNFEIPIIAFSLNHLETLSLIEKVFVNYPGETSTSIVKKFRLTNFGAYLIDYF